MKKFDISKKSDQKRLVKLIKDKAEERAEEIAEKNLRFVTCPKCGQNVAVPKGKTKCPHCKAVID